MVRSAKEAFNEWLRTHDLREFFVWWDQVTPGEKDELTSLLETADSERPIQAFLEKHPHVLIEHLGGGHGRWVIPQKRLGSEFIPDFVIGELSSIGYEWYLVELESPRAQMFTRAGHPTVELNRAINQIVSWRSWLTANRDYAARPRREQGLGLTDISPAPTGLILIGRRESEGETEALRRQYTNDLRIAIHTYDFLVDSLVAERSGNNGNDGA